jgi:hypothetical protein
MRWGRVSLTQLLVLRFLLIYHWGQDCAQAFGQNRGFVKARAGDAQGPSRSGAGAVVTLFLPGPLIILLVAFTLHGESGDAHL